MAAMSFLSAVPSIFFHGGGLPVGRIDPCLFGFYPQTGNSQRPSLFISMEEFTNLRLVQRHLLSSLILLLRHVLRENAFSYDKGVLAEILEPVMGKGLIPADLDTWNMEEFTNLRLVQRHLLSSLILLLRHVLRENAFSYDKGVLAEILEPVMGKGLIPADLDTWKLRRRAITPAFHALYLEAMVKVFSNCSEKMILKSEKLLREKEVPTKFESVLVATDHVNHQLKVRVRHLFSHVDENIVPKWDGELEDENVNHLIRDILHDCVNRKAWDLLETSVTKRTKRKESAPVNVSWDSTNKNKKAKPMEDCRYNADGNDTPSTAMLTMLETLTEKIDNMNTNMATKLMAGLDAAIGTKVDVIIGPLIEKIAILEMDMRKMKGKMVPEETKEAANSNVNINEEVTSDAMSWMLEMKSTSQDGIPARHVVKKVRKTCKKGGDIGLDKNNLFENKVFKTKIQVPHLLDTASEETWSDTKQREKIRKVSDPIVYFYDFSLFFLVNTK
uniref:Uncharacterized protein n=1 Tax=Brassica campestris TaxID=3711 RepID=M4CN02_BRACM